jgi:3-oxoacyl-[acyl-carrier protein] reductase
MAQGTGLLRGHVALITGGVRRIGAATALALAGEGADIVINAKSSRAEGDALVERLRGLGVRAMLHLADVTDEAAVADMMDHVVKTFGRVDILMNNAANRGEGAFATMSLAEWRAVVTPIVEGAFLCSRAAIPHMVANNNGRIVNIGGVTAHAGGHARAHVATAKAALVGLTRALAVEFALKGITANCVVPGKIGGQRSATSGRSVTLPSGSGPIVGREGTPDEVAQVVRMLCIPTGAYITGQTIHVNGGIVMP